MRISYKNTIHPVTNSWLFLIWNFFYSPLPSCLCKKPPPAPSQMGRNTNANANMSPSWRGLRGRKIKTASPLPLVYNYVTLLHIYRYKEIIQKTTTMKKLLLLSLITFSFSLLTFNCFGQYTKLLDFAGATNGKNPEGDLISDGTF